MKKLMFISLCICTMFITLTACSGGSKSVSDPSNPIVGKWEQIVEQNGMNVDAIYEFKSSGDLSQSMTVKSSNPKVNIKGSGKCTYTYENDVITFMFSGKDFDFSKFEIEGLPKSYIDQAMNEMKRSMTDMEQVWTDVVIDGNTMTAYFNGNTITLKRL